MEQGDCIHTPTVMLEIKLGSARGAKHLWRDKGTKNPFMWCPALVAGPMGTQVSPQHPCATMAVSLSTHRFITGTRSGAAGDGQRSPMVSPRPPPKHSRQTMKP